MEIQRDEIILALMLKHFESRLLPETLDIKERVDRGEALSNRAVEFLEETMREIGQTHSIVDHIPEMQPLYARTAYMFQLITSRALENEKALHGIN